MAFVTIADTGIISYISTKNLAERWGFGPLSWLYPLCLDAVAAVGMDLWMSNSPAKRAAAWLSLFAVGLSLGANVADWLYVGVGAAVLGAVPPLMLAALLLTMHYHAARTDQAHAQTEAQAEAQSGPTGTDTVVPVPVTGTTSREDQPQQREAVTATTEPATVEPTAVEPGPVEPGPVAPSSDRTPASARRPRQVRKGTARKGPQPRVPDHEVIAAIRERERTGDPLSRRGVMAEYRMGTPRATRLMAAANSTANNGTHFDITDITGGNS